MSEFVDTPMSKEFVKDDRKGAPGVYDGIDCGEFKNYRRTPSPNGEPEKAIVEFPGTNTTPSGEPDQF